MKNTQLTLLSTRRFLPLFITQFMGAFNDNIFKNALVILITYRLSSDIDMSAQMLVTVAAGIFILPFFLFSATAGQLADKLEKSRLISMIKIIEIILMTIAAGGLYFQNVTLLMLVLFLLGTHSTFFGPLKYAILPDHLRENELIAGNGLIEAGTFLAILVGTLLGGLLILHQYGQIFVITILLMVAIIGWIASLFIPTAYPYHSQIKINYNIIQETKRLIYYSATQKNIFLSIIGISWFWLIGATFIAELPVFVKNILYADNNVVTFFLTLFSVGMGVGSLLCNKLLKGKVHATDVPVASLGMTIFIVDLYFSTRSMNDSFTSLMSLTELLQTYRGWRLVIDLLLLAVCGGLYTVPLYAILQYRSEKAHRARVIASNNVINALFMVLGAVATMLMLKIGHSVTQVFLVVGLVNLPMTLLMRNIR